MAMAVLPRGVYIPATGYRRFGKRFSYSGRIGLVAENQITLRPVLFGSVLPPTVFGLWSVIYRTEQCRLVVIFRFPVLLE
jgi:hypothetical protein